MKDACNEAEWVYQQNWRPSWDKHTYIKALLGMARMTLQVKFSEATNVWVRHLETWIRLYTAKANNVSNWGQRKMGWGVLLRVLGSETA